MTSSSTVFFNIMTECLDHNINEAAMRIRSAHVLWVFAGEGVNLHAHQSLIRSSASLWEAHPSWKELTWFGLNSASAFRRHTNIAWSFFASRLRVSREDPLNESYVILKRWTEKLQARIGVQTTNPDSLFIRAGFNPVSVYEMHGSFHDFQCTLPCCSETWRANEFVSEQTMLSSTPTCPYCGGIARPACLLFDDEEWIDSRADKSKVAFESWFKPLWEQQSNVVILELGADDKIPVLRRIAERTLNDRLEKINAAVREAEGERAQVHHIRINENAYQVTDRHSIGLRGACDDILRQIDGLL